MLAPPHSLHLYLCLPCTHMLEPPHSLHEPLCLPCRHMLAPPHSLHVPLRLPCTHRLAPPHSLHLLLRLPCTHSPLGVCARARFASLPESVPLAFRFLFAPPPTSEPSCRSSGPSLAPPSVGSSSCAPSPSEHGAGAHGCLDAELRVDRLGSSTGCAVPSDRANASCGGGLVRLARSLKKGRAPGAAAALSRWAIKSNEDQKKLGTSWSVTLRARFQFGTRGAEERPNRQGITYRQAALPVFEFVLLCLNKSPLR